MTYIDIITTKNIWDSVRALSWMILKKLGNISKIFISLKMAVWFMLKMQGFFFLLNNLKKTLNWT